MNCIFNLFLNNVIVSDKNKCHVSDPYKGRRVDKNSNYKQKGSYRGTAVGVHPVHNGICCADFSEPILSRRFFI